MNFSLQHFLSIICNVKSKGNFFLWTSSSCWRLNMLFILMWPTWLTCTRCTWGQSCQRTACNTNLFFSFVLFSAVSFAIALCWFVSCLCFISVPIPFHLTPSLYGLPPFISLSVPMLQLRRKTRNHFFPILLSGTCFALIIDTRGFVFLIYLENARPSLPTRYLKRQILLF